MVGLLAVGTGLLIHTQVICSQTFKRGSPGESGMSSTVDIMHGVSLLFENSEPSPCTAPECECFRWCHPHPINRVVCRRQAPLRMACSGLCAILAQSKVKHGKERRKDSLRTLVPK
jgi:hypothetical protein